MLSKYKVKKFWRTLFRPNCFGNPHGRLQICIGEYFGITYFSKRKGFNGKDVKHSCNYYDKCLEEALEELKRKESLGLI